MRQLENQHTAQADLANHLATSLIHAGDPQCLLALEERFAAIPGITRADAQAFHQTWTYHLGMRDVPTGPSDDAR